MVVSHVPPGPAREVGRAKYPLPSLSSFLSVNNINHIYSILEIVDGIFYIVYIINSYIFFFKGKEFNEITANIETVPTKICMQIHCWNKIFNRA
jgi:hypothetical protein